MLRRHNWNTAHCRKLSDIVRCNENSVVGDRRPVVAECGIDSGVIKLEIKECMTSLCRKRPAKNLSILDGDECSAWKYRLSNKAPLEKYRRRSKVPWR